MIMLTEEQTTVVNTIVNAVRVAHKRGAFSLEESAVIGAALQALANSFQSNTGDDAEDSVEDSVTEDTTPAPTTEFTEASATG